MYSAAIQRYFNEHIHLPYSFSVSYTHLTLPTNSLV